jgi:serine/threonine protein phosphatase PrpC
MELEFIQVSDCGRVRDHNEDYLGCVQPDASDREQGGGWLFALADGVGGQDLGEVASRTAVETLLSSFRGSAGGEQLRMLLPRLVQKANAKVFETGLAARPGGSSMATTLVCCALRFDRAVVAHVGDSRCYLIRHGSARSLTRDHSLAVEQVRSGAITGRAAAGEKGHVLTRSLGNGMFVNVDTGEHPLIGGDVLLLCSDGLHGSVSTAELGEIVSSRAGLHDAASQLISIANERDGTDNVSIQLIRVKSIERAGMYRGRMYKLA